VKAVKCSACQTLQLAKARAKMVEIGWKISAAELPSAKCFVIFESNC
jgi:hypothetical protein